MSDSLPKGRDGKPLGKVVEIEYDVVDVPARDFRTLLGSPQLRLAIGILNTMLGSREDELPEVLKPLLEITDQELRIELWKELLLFVDKALRAHNRQVDAIMLKKTLEPIFQDEVNTMIKSIFDEKFFEGKSVGIAEGEARGEARGEIKGKASIVIQILLSRFNRIPKTMGNRLLAIGDPVVLDSLALLALKCESLKEFKNALE